MHSSAIVAISSWATSRSPLGSEQCLLMVSVAPGCARAVVAPHNSSSIIATAALQSRRFTAPSPWHLNAAAIRGFRRTLTYGRIIDAGVLRQLVDRASESRKQPERRQISEQAVIGECSNQATSPALRDMQTAPARRR